MTLAQFLNARSDVLKVTALKGASTSLGFLAIVLLANLLGPAEFGIYSALLAVLSVATIPLVRGCPTLIVRSTASSAGEPNQLESLSLIRIVDRVGTIWIAFTCLILLGANQFELFLPRGSEGKIVVGCLAMLAILSANSRSAVTWGNGFTVRGHIPDQFVRPASLLVFTGFLYFSRTPEATHAIIVTLASALVSLAAARIILSSTDHLLGSSNQLTFSDYIMVVRSIIPISSIAGMQVLNGQLDLILLAALSSAEDVGRYRLSAAFSTNIALGVIVANALYAPSFARNASERRVREIKEVYGKFTRVAVGIGFAAFIAIVFFVLVLFDLVFASEYSDAKHLILALSAAQLATLWAAGANILLVMLHDEKFVFRAILYSVLVKLLIGLPLISLMGAWGAVWASIVSLAFWRMLIWSRYRRIIQAI